jgi:hypothetical protein
MLPVGIQCTSRIKWWCSLDVERVKSFASMSREWPFRARDLAFVDAMEDCVEVLNGLKRLYQEGRDTEIYFNV